MLLAKFTELSLEILKKLTMFPYHYVYHRNYIRPWSLSLKHDQQYRVQVEAGDSLKLKLHEAQDVQVAVGPTIDSPLLHFSTSQSPAFYVVREERIMTLGLSRV